jgi:hypothetical protein
VAITFSWSETIDWVVGATGGVLSGREGEQAASNKIKDVVSSNKRCMDALAEDQENRLIQYITRKRKLFKITSFVL